MENNVRLITYIATLKRGLRMEPESYYVYGTSTEEASARLARIAKVTKDQIVELKCQPDPSGSPAG